MTRAVPSVAFLMLIMLWFAGSLVDALSSTLKFDAILFDGPMQLYNPLRRIDAGQRGGVDFQFFHGILVPYIHYPLYSVLGKTVFASELSRHIMNAVAVLVGYCAVFAGLTRRLNATLGLTAAAIAMSYALNLAGMLSPSPSLIGLRSTMPLVVFGVFLAGMKSNIEAYLIGCLCALGVLAGTEYGVSSGVMAALTVLGRWCVGCQTGGLGWITRAMAAFIGTATLILLAIGGPTGALAALRYAFIELPQDQFWYFGAPPNLFLSRADQLLNRTLWVWAIGPSTLLGVGILSALWSHPPARAVGVVLLAAILAACFGGVGYLGYTSDHYLLPISRMNIVVAIAVVWHLASWLTTDPVRGHVVIGVCRTSMIIATLILLLVGPTKWSVLRTPQLVDDLASLSRSFQKDHGTFAPRLCQHRDTVIAAIDADRASRGITRAPRIWSTYAGLVEAHYGVFHPAEDYIIHAIGKSGRERYLMAFRTAEPDYVVTCRPDTMAYEVWLQNTSWPFYEEVAMNYDVLALTSDAILWVRRPVPWETPDTADGQITVIPTYGKTFSTPGHLEPTPEGMYVVEVQYSIENRYAGIPILGGLARQLIFPSGCVNELPVSLPPYQNTLSFAVRPFADRDATFWAGTASLVGGSRLTVEQVHFRPVRAGGRELAFNDPTWYLALRKHRQGK